MILENNAASTGKCPFHGAGSEFKPFDQTYWEDPYPFWENARQNEPVFYHPELNYWVVTRYADIKKILAEPASFSSKILKEAMRPLSQQAIQILREGEVNPNNTVTNDDPEHKKIRRPINYAFVPKRVNEMESKVRALVSEYIDRFIYKEKVDLVSEMFFEFPAEVLFEFLGFPKKYLSEIKQFSEQRLLLRFGNLPAEEQVKEAHGVVDFWRLSKKMVKEVADAEVTPDNFLGDLLRYRNGDDTILSLEDISGILYGLLFAGHETTTNLAGNAIRTLLTERHEWDEICANTNLIPNAIEEVMRYNPPVFYWRRRALKSVNIGGVEIPEGGNLLLVMASSGHDEAKFEEPEKFDIHRKNTKDHLGFGFGKHFCIGAPLARLEVRVILEEFAKRLPNLQLVEDEIKPIVSNLFARGPKELWVKW
ncbi:cytochrome P450 [Neobacillus niacini]|uniref:cytochrome P450 n=1 Tax=Neobacillus niacini TaxID=86668 RepID=UPI002863B663|nr:cytochrome P450 [Neobacillus niacini]MDR7076834.1 cytochrome P450 [Neobacillus niacini]